MFTEAEEGYGGFIASRLNDIICCAKSKQNEKPANFLYKELLIKSVLPSFYHILKNQSIQVNINNSSACQILTVGISKTSLGHM